MATVQERTVQARAEVITLPTYELLREDLNPILDKHLNPYPYTMQNHRNAVRSMKTYDAVILENEYLHLTFLPTLGGRLYRAEDKRTGKEFLYTNKVIKPRMIGTRGAWFSGGMEFNTPISHSPTTMDRVNCLALNHADGSSSVIFGSIEQISYMNWKIEIKLYPGQAYMEQRVYLTNPTPKENRFYFWTNTAVSYNQSVELIYPFDWCLNHIDASYLKWPFYLHHDCRQASEIPYSYETFGKLMNHNFCGIYNHEEQYGVVHYADRKKVKGAKFFSWGNDANAHAWTRSLTDDDSAYIEMQSGLFESQMVYKFLRPHQTLTWTEYWYPVSDMNGFRYAEKEVAVQFETSASGITFTFAATEKLEACLIQLTCCGEQQQAVRDLTPDQNVRMTFSLSRPLGEDSFQLDLYCAGRRILSFGERDEFTFEYPDHALFEDSRNVVSAEDQEKHYKMGELKESLGQWAEAVQRYEANLVKYPTCTLTLNRLGQLLLARLEPQRAMGYFIQVLHYDNRNSKARFHLALAEKMLGNRRKARRLLLDIAADAEYAQASAIELAKLNISMSHWKEVQSSREYLLEGSDPYRRTLLAAAYRHNGMLEAAERVLSDPEDAYPYSPMLRMNEYVLVARYLIRKDDAVRSELLRYTCGDERILLPIALDYMEMGLHQDAAEVAALVAEPSMKTSFIKVGLTDAVTAEERKRRLEKVLSASLDYIFLNEPQLVLMAERYRSLDDSGKLDYLVGNYYYAVGRLEEARYAYERAYNSGLRYSVLLRNLGFKIYYEQLQDMALSEKVMAEDVALNGGANVDCLLALDQIYMLWQDFDRRKQMIERMEQLDNRSLVLIALVEAYKAMGDESKAWAILQQEEFENWEGKELSGPCYRDFVIHMAMKHLNEGQLELARQWIDRVDQYPANLNYGDSKRVSLSEMYYYKAMIYRRLGEMEAARQWFRAGYLEHNEETVAQDERSPIYRMLCLQALQQG
ncbi:DUF5107 domain-containing protein [Paenibacillus guangzhouensis]|uniref:DUF5107 domain-containing protein n=1 Tax=Paenibacillus guangzhouensis TaxID=1473112 RepID=UPI00187B9C65|nr:DUF5107 domain-containing protein [Paenibacillus guangzhouensis]